MAYEPLVKSEGKPHTVIPESYVPLVKQSSEYVNTIHSEIERDIANAPDEEEKKSLFSKLKSFFVPQQEDSNLQKSLQKQAEEAKQKADRLATTKGLVQETLF